MDDFEVIKSQAIEWIRLERWSQAMEALKELTRVQPENYELAYNRGLVHWKLGDVLKAESWLRRTLALKPNYAPAVQALTYLAEPIRMAWATQAHALMEAEDWPGALEIFDRLREQFPQDADCRYQLGLIYQRNGALPVARDHFRNAVAFAPDNPKYLAALAQVEAAMTVRK